MYIDSLRPNLPKRLAARIRALQYPVFSIRSRIEYGEQRLVELRTELEKFDADPATYARLRGSGNHAPDTYPIQAGILHSRGKLEYYIYSFPAKYETHREASAALKAGEHQVFAEVCSMRPSLGRVLWPDPLPEVSKFFSACEATWAQQTPEVRSYHVQREIESVKQLDDLRGDWLANRHTGPVVIELDTEPYTRAHLPASPATQIYSSAQTLGLSWPVSIDELRMRYLDLERNPITLAHSRWL